MLLWRRSFFASKMRTTTLLLLFVINAGSQSAPVAFTQDSSRVMPPRLECDRSDLTLFDGRVLIYRRRQGSTFLRLRTNFDTTENVNIRHPQTKDASKFFMINGETFTKEDWRRLEKRPGVLRSGMRANVWICRGNPSIQPVVDWRPDDTGVHPRSR